MDARISSGKYLGNKFFVTKVVGFFICVLFDGNKKIDRSIDQSVIKSIDRFIDRSIDLFVY